MKWILQKQDVIMWTSFICLGEDAVTYSCERDNHTIEFYKRRGIFWTIWATISFSGRPLSQAVSDVIIIMKLKIVVLISTQLISKKWGTTTPHRNLQFINLILLELHGYIHSMITCIYFNVTIKPWSRYSPSSHDSGSYPFQRLCHWSNAVDVGGGGFLPWQTATVCQAEWEETQHTLDFLISRCAHTYSWTDTWTHVTLHVTYHQRCMLVVCLSWQWYRTRWGIKRQRKFCGCKLTRYINFVWSNSTPNLPRSSRVQNGCVVQW